MEKLRAYMVKHEISQAQLAELIGVKQPSVWEWLNGESMPRSDNLRKISEVTGLSVDELLAS